MSNLALTAKIVIGAVDTLARRAQAYFSALLVPGGALIAVNVLVDRDSLASSPATFAIVTLANLGLYVVIAVAAHRVTLLGGPATRIPTLTIGRNEFVFFQFLITLMFVISGIALALALAISVPMITFQMISGANEQSMQVAMSFVSGIVLVVSFYLTARLSLVFPACSIGDPKSFSDSWRLTENYQLPMFIITIVLPFLLSIPPFVLADYNSFAVRLGLEVGKIITLALTITALSLAYLEITRAQTTNEAGSE